MRTKRKRIAPVACGQSGSGGKPATRSKGAPVKGSTGAKKRKHAAQVLEKTTSSVKTSKRENYDSEDPPPTIDMATAQAEQPLAATWLSRDAARDAALGARRQGRLVGTVDVRFCCEPAVLAAMTKENDVPVTRKQFAAPVRQEDVYWKVDTGETYSPQGQLPLSRFLESLDTGDVELCEESHMEVLEALWALQFPKASPWKRPFIRLLTRVVPVDADGGDDGAEQEGGDYCVTFFVYVSRLIFELIGDSSCKTLLRALVPAGPVVPTTPVPAESFKMFKRTEGGGEEDEEYTLSGVLRAAESEGYKIRDPQPANLKLTMFEFQRSSYQWMLDQERDARGINYRLWEVRRWKDAVDDDDCLYVGLDTGEFRLCKPPRRTGGVLADEMGLGKTLMTISLILGNPKRQRGPLKRGGIESAHGVEESKKGEAVKKEAPELDDDDAEVEANDRGEAAATAPHRYIPSRATLVVVPMTLLLQWRMEVEKIVDVKATGFRTMIFSSPTVRRTVKLRDIRLLDAEEDTEPPTMADLAREEEVLVPWVDDLGEMYGPGSSDRQSQFFRAKLCSFNESNEECEVLLILEEMAEQDIVITSYDTLRQHGTFLKKFAWYRVVLDECQEIRTATTQVAKLCSGLAARHRWMVSGTPLVGGIDDLHGELAFLNVWPFSLHNDGFWELRVAKPFKAKQLEALRLLHKLISVTMMRHSKAQTYLDGRPLLSIPSRTIVWQPVPLASVSERFLYTYLEVAAAKECRRQLENLEKATAAEAAEAAAEMGGEGNEEEEEEEVDEETAKKRKEKREERKRRFKERAERAAERVKELKVAAAGRHGKLRSLLFYMTRCLFHSSLINLQQLDTIKRTLQVQAQFALASASGNINDGIPKMRVEDVLVRLQGVGASRENGLNRDVGRTWAVGGDSMLDKRAMYEQKSLNELRQMVRQLDLPMPTVWLQMPFRGTIEKESMVLETSPPVPTEKDKDAAAGGAAPAAQPVNDPLIVDAAASDASIGGGIVEGRLTAPHAMNHIEDGAAGSGVPKSLTQLIQPDDVLRIGGHGDDLEVVVTSVQEDDEDVTQEKKQGSVKGTVYLDKPWASEPRTMCSVFRRSEAVRRKPYVDLLLTRENEQKGLSDQIHEAGFSALYSILQGKDVSCPICLCTLESPTITSCGHAFCRVCIITMLEQAEHSQGMVQARCAICRKGVTRQQLMQLDTDSIEDFNEHEANTSASAHASTGFVVTGAGGAASSSNAGASGGSSGTPSKARQHPGAASSSSAVSPSPTPTRATRGRRRGAVNISADDNGKATATEAWHHDIADVGFPPAATDESLSEMPTPLNIPRDHRLPSLEPAFLSHLANTRNVMSSKMRTLLADMDRTLETDSTSKFIVFSQFTNLIELIGSVLKDRGINSVEVTGHSQKQARQRAVTAFNSDPTCKAFLVTMGAGAAGLTLTAANTVYLLEPAHSLADEAQALSRAHRIGQTRPVRCVILFCPGTFEERMLATRLMHHKGDKAALIRKLESADALAVVRTTGVDSNNGSATHFSLEQLAVLFGVQQPPERMDIDR